VRIAGPARPAHAARHHRKHRHPIARFPSGDTLADLVDHSRRLVPDDLRRLRASVEIAEKDVQIRATNSAMRYT